MQFEAKENKIFVRVYKFYFFMKSYIKEYDINGGVITLNITCYNKIALFPKTSYLTFALCAIVFFLFLGFLNKYLNHNTSALFF